MTWKIFHETAVQVGELKLHKRKDITYIHPSEEHDWNRNQDKMPHQDTSILFELITRDGWGLTLLEGKAVSTLLFCLELCDAYVRRVTPSTHAK